MENVLGGVHDDVCQLERFAWALHHLCFSLLGPTQPKARFQAPGAVIFGDAEQGVDRVLDGGIIAAP